MPDTSGDQAGSDGRRGGRGHGAGQQKIGRVHCAFVRQVLEIRQKSKKRSQKSSSGRCGLESSSEKLLGAIRKAPRGGRADRAEQPPLGGEPPPLEVERLAPVTWRGPTASNMAFKQQHERTIARQWGIKSDVDLFPERDGNDPANDPCPDCEHMVCVCL